MCGPILILHWKYFSVLSISFICVFVHTHTHICMHDIILYSQKIIMIIIWLWLYCEMWISAMPRVRYLYNKNKANILLWFIIGFYVYYNENLYIKTYERVLGIAWQVYYKKVRRPLVNRFEVCNESFVQNEMVLWYHWEKRFRQFSNFLRGPGTRQMQCCKQQRNKTSRWTNVEIKYSRIWIIGLKCKNK